jgi:hypothetical protein
LICNRTSPASESDRKVLVSLYAKSSRKHHLPNGMHYVPLGFTASRVPAIFQAENKKETSIMFGIYGSHLEPWVVTNSPRPFVCGHRATPTRGQCAAGSGGIPEILPLKDVRACRPRVSSPRCEIKFPGKNNPKDRELTLVPTGCRRSDGMHSSRTQQNRLYDECRVRRAVHAWNIRLLLFSPKTGESYFLGYPFMRRSTGYPLLPSFRRLTLTVNIPPLPIPYPGGAINRRHPSVPGPYIQPKSTWRVL